MKNGTYITIQSWMRTELDLKGNDLIVYAIIFGFSQTENTRFTGSLQYLADWCGATKQGILKNIKSLIDKGLIEKTVTEDGVKYNCTPLNIVERTIKHSLTPIKHSLTNNIDKQSISKDIDLKDKDNIKNFEFGKTVEHKKSLYDRCVNHINSFTENREIKELLFDFLNSLSEMKKLRGENQFVGILKKLKDYGDTDEKQIKIIQYTIEHGYSTFYEYKEFTKKSNVSSDIGKHAKRLTAEEKQRAREAIANGTAEKY